MNEVGINMKQLDLEDLKLSKNVTEYETASNRGLLYTLNVLFKKRYNSLFYTQLFMRLYAY